MLHVATCLWDANEHSMPASRCYDETWVEKLYRGFRRNLTVPFRFVCFTERKRCFPDPIQQELLSTDRPGYGAMIEPFRLNVPMILVGLDTVVVGNIDHMARHCEITERMALPRDPYQPSRSINGVALVPGGQRAIRDEWNGENDMDWLRGWPCDAIDNLFPGEVLSLKFHDVRGKGLQEARIVYMHGRHKPHELTHLPWIQEHWR